MKRRTLLRSLSAAAASLPLARVSLQAQDLASDQVFLLRDVAATVLPSAIGSKGQNEAVDNFLRWIRDYKEGVPLSHGYGEPRLVKTGPSPAPGYAKQLAALEQAAKARGGRFGALPLEYLSAEFNAIQLATALGINVIEPAGNGEQHFDDWIDGPPCQAVGSSAYVLFDPNLRSSGAVMVGAVRRRPRTAGLGNRQARDRQAGCGLARGCRRRDELWLFLDGTRGVARFAAHVLHHAWHLGCAACRRRQRLP